MLTITDDNFDVEVMQSNSPVLVDFWAEWCAPCRMVGPVIDELAEEYKEKIKIGKVNVDENSQTPSKFGIMSIPTLMFFKGGEPVKTLIGAQSKETLKREIDSILTS
ncbi:MAG: thioredoxin [Patescibacteria group bacterium]|nr:thioredoxin [Patescibacteria group bacterium]